MKILLIFFLSLISIALLSKICVFLLKIIQMCSINILEQTIECVTHVDIQYNVLVLAISGCIHKVPKNSKNIIHGAIKDKVLIKFCNYLHCWTITFQEMVDILMGFRISIQYPSGSLMKASPFIFPSFGFFTNSTPKDSNRSQALSTSGTTMPI